MATRYDPIDLGPIAVQFVRVFFAKANTEVPVPHDLREPIGWPLVSADKKCIISNGQMPQAPNVLQLVSDTDTVTATILVMAVNRTER